MPRRESISSQHRLHSGVLDGQLGLYPALCQDCGVSTAQVRIHKRRYGYRKVEMVCVSCGGPVIEAFGCQCGR
jgi:hypothetical protein